MLLKNKRTIIYLSLISMILILLSILTLSKVVDYSFITGYVLGSCFLHISFIFMKLATKDLTNNLNPYNYVFLSTTRIGFYIVPFLISFYLHNIFSVYGVLIAFVINWTFLVFTKMLSK
ncbi:MG406 family protein [Spiroplasma endosymbiont of Diplazon laetatorius]|uniref:MG406 family protein n=1 Tax=Spiroplasma endosymbiont of Diplazon laetatorius TaxID=3066322 RepID=UPI003BAF59A3